MTDKERADYLQKMADLGLQGTLRFRPSDPIVNGQISACTKLKLLCVSNALIELVPL